MALLLVANVCLGASLVFYDAILVMIATPDERDAVSSRGWARGRSPSQTSLTSRVRHW